MSDQDIESKFSSLSLAFKTDRITLAERLELQHRYSRISTAYTYLHCTVYLHYIYISTISTYLHRQRDIAERNAEDEIRQLKSSVQCLNR